MATPFAQVNRDINPNNDIVDNLTGFVNLSFGGESITLVDPQIGAPRKIPQYLQSFEFHRVTNGLGRFSITLVDPEWTDVESKILSCGNSGKKATLEYGMLGIDGKTNSSSVIDILLLKYDMEMFLNYSVLTVQGLCLGVATLGSSLVGSSSKATSFLKDTVSSRGTTNVSSYMYELARVLGFSENNIDIEPTASNFSKEDLGTTEDKEKILTCDNGTILNFITSVLIPKAVSNNKKKSPFVFYVSKGIKPSDTAGKSASGKETNVSTSEEKGKDGGEVFRFHSVARDIDKSPRTKLTLFSDKASHIKYFKPSFEHSVANISKGTDVVAYGYDRVSGGLIGEARHNNSGTSKQDSPTPVPTARSAGYTPGVRANQVEALDYVHAVATNAPLTAELVMVGDVSYNLLDCMDIFVNIPVGTRKGEPHNTSNRYIVIGITDTISEGVFETKLRLCTGFGFTPAGEAVTKDQEARADRDAVEQMLAADVDFRKYSVPAQQPFSLANPR